MHFAFPKRQSSGEKFNLLLSKLYVQMSKEPKVFVVCAYSNVVTQETRLFFPKLIFSERAYRMRIAQNGANLALVWTERSRQSTGYKAGDVLY